MWILDPSYLAILVAGGAASLLLAGWILLRGAGEVVFERVLLAAAAVGACSFAQLAAVRFLGGNLFAVLMLAWIDLGILAPACGALVLLRGRRRATRAVRVVAWLVLLPVPLSLWASLVEPGRLIVERPRLVLQDSHEGDGPLRLGVLADLQTTLVRGHERAAVRALMAEAPDVILVPGDLWQGPMSLWPRAREELRTLLGELDAPGGVFVVSGNSGFKAGLPELLEGTRCQLLVNRPVEVRVAGRRMVVLGLEDAGFTRRVVSDFEDRARQDPGAVHVLLVHRPGAGLAALDSDSPIDLVVAGHTHGGQVVVPGFGPPITLSAVPRAVAAGGLHPTHGTHLYVSRGVGMERKWAPRIRLFCPPEVTLLTCDDG
jgi:predicted MPP superfamily phosphohydrolase